MLFDAEKFDEFNCAIIFQMRLKTAKLSPEISVQKAYPGKRKAPKRNAPYFHQLHIDGCMISVANACYIVWVADSAVQKNSVSF